MANGFELSRLDRGRIVELPLTAAAAGHYTVKATATADGNGYWLVTKTGGVYAFGDAAYYGAPGHGIVTSAVRTPDGRGYWVLLSDGEVFAYDDQHMSFSLENPT